MKKIIKQHQPHQQLDEINMAPGQLMRQSLKIKPVVGMEYEVCLPAHIIAHFGASGGLPNNESVYSISAAIDFFANGEIENNRNILNTVRTQLEEQARAELEDKIKENFDNNTRRIFTDWYKKTYDLSEVEDIATRITKQRYPDMNTASNRFKQEYDYEYQNQLRKELEEAYEDESLKEECFDAIREQYLENSDPDDVPDDMHLMSDVYAKFSNIGLRWPYDNQQDEIAEIANSFGKAVGRAVNSSPVYHGAKREDGKYSVEPDASIEPNEVGDSGVEFITPAISFESMLKEFPRAIRWFDSVGAYTNESTGLHMNISFPGLNIQQLDYVKLVLLVGDQYVLEKFGRLASTYCRSALSKVKAKTNDELLSNQVLELMRKHLTVEASHLIHAPETLKNVSINLKESYVEFRAPGGNWLDYPFEKLIGFMTRFVVALDSAADPMKDRKEYLTKLYKIISANLELNEQNKAKQIAQYMTGEK